MSPVESNRLAKERIEKRIDEVLAEVRKEVLAAALKHAPMNSPHEGYGVLLEEVDELWDEIKADRGRDRSARVEAKQVAAMGVRYILDLFDPPKPAPKDGAQSSMSLEIDPEAFLRAVAGDLN